MDLPAPIYFQRRANSWLKQLRGRAFDKGLLPLVVGDVPLDFLDVLKGELNVKNGIALSRLSIAKQILDGFTDEEISLDEMSAKNSIAELAQLLPDGKRIKTTKHLSDIFPKLRSYAYELRNELRLKRKSLRNKINIPQPKSDKRLLILPRLASHLHSILPVASLLSEKDDVQILFGVVKEELEDSCLKEGFDAVNLIQIENDTQLKRQAKETLRKLHEFMQKDLMIDADDNFSGAEVAALKTITEQIVSDNLLHALRVAKGVDAVFREFKPTLFFASNPYTIEGRTGVYVAKTYNVPTASAEHGSIFPDDPIWQECLVDLVCVFGEPSRRALLTCGVKDEHIKITGASGFDKVYKFFQERNDKEKEANILVATSGPGDQVSLEQHQRFIKILYEASTLVPHIRWTVKLHSKDDVRFYERVALDFTNANIDVTKSDNAHFGADIFDYLAKARGLVTICSTSALDAMLVDVPVIAVNLESKEKGLQGIEFLERGCAMSVDNAKDLADAAEKCVNGLRDEKIDIKAKEYISEHFANFGTATERVAEELFRLMEKKF